MQTVNKIYRFKSKVLPDGHLSLPEEVAKATGEEFEVTLNPVKAEHLAGGECSLAGIIDIATDCTDRDISSHHDKYLYGAVLD